MLTLCLRYCGRREGKLVFCLLSLQTDFVRRTVKNWSEKFRCASGSAVQSFTSQTGESHGNFYPKIVDVLVEIRTGHVLITSQALLLDRTRFCNEERAFGAALLGNCAE